jgi:hypothetical protein
MVDILAAIATTKRLILRKDGVWKMAYETRTDWPMRIGALLLPLVGAGTWSLDVLLTRASLYHRLTERRYG